MWLLVRVYCWLATIFALMVLIVTLLITTITIMYDFTTLYIVFHMHIKIYLECVSP